MSYVWHGERYDTRLELIEAICRHNQERFPVKELDFNSPATDTD